MSQAPYEFDFLVFIGRFQPFHRGHFSVVKAGLAKSQQLIVLCGSCHQPRSTRNPWDFGERKLMIEHCLTEPEQRRVHIAPLMDSLYNDEAWVRSVQTTVNGLVTAHYPTPHRQPRIGLIGHSKDNSSFYLNLFPQWGAVQVENVENISATPIREAYLTDAHSDSNWRSTLPDAVIQQLQETGDKPGFQEVKEEYRFIQKYKSAWEAAPYDPTFVTVDAVVVQSGHILMVERRARPGKGLMALPGGFVDQDETLVDACVRELREETRLKVPHPVLKGCIRKQQVFDDPYRSARGRTITHAFYIELPPRSELPPVKGGDDAAKAFWLPLAELAPNKLFEDHYFIIQNMTGC